MFTGRPRSAANNSSFRYSMRLKTGFLSVRRRQAWSTVSRETRHKAMSETGMNSDLPRGANIGVSQSEVSIGQIFLEFLIIGATSFGGVVPYLRGSLVTKRHWIDDKEFVEMLSISQSLPGLNATNMAILVGEKLRGALGAVVAIMGICLPGAVIMYVVGIFYRSHGDHVWVTAALKGVAAAAVGMVLSTVVGLSKKSLA